MALSSEFAVVLLDGRHFQLLIFVNYCPTALRLLCSNLVDQILTLLLTESQGVLAQRRYFASKRVCTDLVARRQAYTTGFTLGLARILGHLSERKINDLLAFVLVVRTTGHNFGFRDNQWGHMRISRVVCAKAFHMKTPQIRQYFLSSFGRFQTENFARTEQLLRNDASADVPQRIVIF